LVLYTVKKMSSSCCKTINCIPNEASLGRFVKDAQF